MIANVTEHPEIKSLSVKLHKCVSFCPTIQGWYDTGHVMADSPSGILSAVAAVMGRRNSSTSVVVAMTTHLAASRRISNMMSKEQQHPSELELVVFTQYLADYWKVAGQIRPTAMPSFQRRRTIRP
jgi:hypothetical protein